MTTILSALVHLWNDANGKRGVCKHAFSRKTSGMRKKSYALNVNQMAAALIMAQNS